MTRAAAIEAGLWRWLPLVMLTALALLVVPATGESSFSGPKTAAWAAFAAMLAVLGARRTTAAEPRLTPPIAFAALNALAWAIASTTGDAARPDAVLLQGLAAVTWLTLAFHRPRAADVAAAATFAGTAVAAATLAQGLGLDPFASFTPAHFTSARMSLYSTLGNPDFVAGFITPCVVLAASRKRWAASALMLAALCLTRSWATVLALGAAAAMLRSKQAIALAALAALAAAAAATRAPSGRLELWAQALPYLNLTGHGPGAALALTGTDHPHSDFIERWLDAGPLGAAALIAPLVYALRKRTPTAAALAAFAARMAVDFPLARPAELCLFVFLITSEEEP